MSVLDRIAFFLVAGSYSLAGTAADHVASARGILWAFVDAFIVLVVAGALCGVALGRLRWRLLRIIFVTAVLGLVPFSTIIFSTLLDTFAPTVQPLHRVWMHPKIWVPILPSVVGALVFTGCFLVATKRRANNELHERAAV